MTRTRYIATAALALGALTATALQTSPADAFQTGLKAAGDAGSSVHTVAGRPGSFGNGPIPAAPGRNPIPFDPPGNLGSGGGKFTSQKHPGAFDPNRIPGANGGSKLPTPTSQKNPNSFDPSRIPGGNGGGNLPPIGDPIANPNLPGGGNGGGNKGPKGRGHGHLGVYVGIGGDGGGYHPCQWLRRNYHFTGRVYWLKRYRHCLWRHYAY